MQPAVHQLSRRICIGALALLAGAGAFAPLPTAAAATDTVSITATTDSPMLLQIDTSLSPGNTYGFNLSSVSTRDGTVKPDVTIDWGDGSPSMRIKGEGHVQHLYGARKRYTVSLSGSVPWFRNGGGCNWSEDQNFGRNQATKLIEVTSFGSTIPRTLECSFSEAFNQPIGTWNTAEVTSMSFMFLNASSFNQALNRWGTENVTDMVGTFIGAGAFNRPIEAWNTSSVTNMGGMFYEASAFNQPIGAWNTANVTNMSAMFSRSTSFNQPISSWNVVRTQKWGFFSTPSRLSAANTPAKFR
jgi:surface protein